MRNRTAHLASLRATPRGRGTTTLSASSREDVPSGAAAGDGGAADLFGDVPPAVRLQMELIARASSDPEAALPEVIALLVPGPAAKRAAIVTAISTNDPLREQWERTWEVLRR